MYGATDHYRIENELNLLGYFDGHINDPAKALTPPRGYYSCQVWVPYMPATTMLVTTLLIRDGNPIDYRKENNG